VQKHFIEKYGNKIIYNNDLFNVPGLRHVSMENTLLDLFIAGHGIEFTSVHKAQTSLTLFHH